MELILTYIKIKPFSINKAWQGRRYRTGEYKGYTKEMLFILPKRKMIKGQVAVDLTFYLKHPLVCDADNFLKPVLDILVKKGYIEDDRYVFKIKIKKVESEDEGEGIKIKIIKL